MEIIESYFINSKLYVSTSFICAYFNKSEKQVGRWKAAGMPIVQKKPKELNKVGNWYILDYVILWVDKNINKVKSGNSSKQKVIEDEDKSAEDIIYNENLTISEKRKALQALGKNKLDELNTAEQILEREAKNKAHDKNWVRKEKPSESIKALARSFISLLKNMMISISKDGEMKKQDELYHIIDKLAHTEIQKLQRFLQQEGNDIDLHEVYSIMIHLNESGVSLDDIAKKIRELE